MCAGGPGGHVEALAGLVVDMGEQQHRGVLVERLCEIRARDHLQPGAGDAGDRTLGDMEVGREIAGLAHHRVAVGIGAQRRDQRLEQMRRGRVADDHLVRGGADQWGDLRADPLRRVDPALVPAADQPVAPLAGRDVGERGGRRLGKRAE